jgi:endonuclease-3
MSTRFLGKDKKMSNNDVIIERLSKHYEGAKPGLHYQTPFQLLIATIMSAQTTDKQVNAVTETLFAKYPDAQSLAVLDIAELEQLIKSTGFYHTKASNVLKTCQMLVLQYDDQVPKTMEELTKFPGVGRKTANVVLSNAFGIPAIAVDTHVFRVSNRLGLANAKDEATTEAQLMQVIPREQWGDAHHWLIWHGRKICSARALQCITCFLVDVCKWGIAQQ